MGRRVACVLVAVALLAALPSCGDTYKTCDAMKKAGVAPIPEGSPGYSQKLDQGRTGWACGGTGVRRL